MKKNLVGIIALIFLLVVIGLTLFFIPESKQVIQNLFEQAQEPLLAPTYYATCRDVPTAILDDYIGGCVPVYDCGTLSSADTYYLLMNDITSAAATCFNVVASNITLDLNNFTYTTTFYDQNIQVGIGVDFFELKNGKIIDASPPASLSAEDAIVRFSSNNGGRVHDIYFETNNRGPAMIKRRGDSFGTLEIYNSVFNNTDSAAPDNTHAVESMITTYAITDGSGYMSIHDSYFYGSPHPLSFGGYTAGSGGRTDVYNNFIAPSKTRRNPYAMSLQADGGGEIYNNTIISNASRGILIQNAWNYDVHDNYIELAEPDMTPTIDGLGTKAFRIREVDTLNSPNMIGSYHNRIYNNHIVVHAYEGNAEGFNIGTFNVGNNTIFNNTVEAYRHTSNIDWKAVTFIVDDADGDCIDGSHPNGDFGIGWTTMYENKLYGNSYLVKTFGENGGVSNCEFTNFTFVQTGDSIDNYTIWVGESNGIFPSINHSFVNPTLLGGASFDSSDWFSISTPKEFFVKWFLDVEVLDGGSPVTDGIVVTIEDSQGIFIYPTTTNGKIPTQILSQFDDYDDNDYVPERTYYTPHNVSVTYNGETKSQLVTLDSSQSLSFDFVGEPSPEHLTCDDVPVEVLAGYSNGCVPVYDCGTLSTANTYYLLDNNIRSDDVCLIVLTSNIVIDLNNYTITFGDSIPLEVPNGGFESGTGINADNWDQTGTDVERVNVFPVTKGSWAYKELESWAMRFPAFGSGNFVYSDPIPVISGKTYIISAMIHNSMDIPSGMVVEIDNGEGCTVAQARFADNWAANYCSFRATTSSVRIRMAMTNLSYPNDFFVDSVMLKPGPLVTSAYGPVRVNPGIGGYYGIHADAWNLNSIKVTNGKIIEGQEDSILPLAVHVRGSNSDVSYLEIITHGADGSGIEGFGDYSEIHHNNITLNSERTHWSHEAQARAIHMTGAQSAKVYENNILRSPSTGIGTAYTGGAPYSEVFNNTINIESSGIHSAAIYIMINGKIYNNYINNTRGGGIEGDGAEGTEIYNNYVEVRDGPQEERGWTSKALWIRYYSGGLDIYNNSFIGYSGVGVPRVGSDSDIALVRIGAYDDSRGPINFYNNYLEARTNNKASSTGAIALDLNTDSFPYGGVTKYIYNNTIISNHKLIVLGNLYGTGNYNFFKNNTLIKASDADSIPGEAFTTIYHGFYGGVSNEFLDTSLQGGASFSNSYFGSATFDACCGDIGFREFNISWTLTTEVFDSGVPANNVRLEIWNNFNQKIEDKIINGVSFDSLVEQEYGGRGSFSSLMTLDNHSPYIINVTYNGETISRLVDMNQTRTENFVFTGGAPVPITINSNFDSASIGTYVINGDEVNFSVWIDQTPYEENLAYWVNFNVSNVLGKTVTFNILNADQVGAPNNIYLPNFPHNQYEYSCDGLNWNKITNRVYNVPVYTFTQTFPCDEAQIATSAPFSYQDMQNYLTSIEVSPYVNRTNLGFSSEGRNIDFIEVTNTAVPASGKTHVFITSRHHPGELTASHMLKGFIDFLISSDPTAVSMRDNFMFHIVPIVGPDGVFNGRSRFDIDGINLNRDWSSTFGSTEIPIVRNKFDQVNLTYGTDLFLDWHSELGNNDLINYVWIPSDFMYPLTENFFSNLSSYTSYDEKRYAASGGSSNLAYHYSSLGGIPSITLEANPHLETWTIATLEQEGVDVAYAFESTFVGAPAAPTCPVSGGNRCWYVDNTNGACSDSLPTAGDWDTPFCTLGGADAAHVGGDHIYVLPGEYREEFDLKSGIDPNQRTVLSGYGAREDVKIIGSDPVEGWTQCTAALCPGVPTDVWYASFTNPGMRWEYIDGACVNTGGGVYTTDCFEDTSNWYLRADKVGGSFLSSLDESDIDVPGEYYYDYAASRVYLRPFNDDDPNGHSIQCTKRKFILSRPSNFNLENLTFMYGMEGIVGMASTSRYATINNIVGKFISGKGSCGENPHAIYHASEGTLSYGSGINITNNLFHDIGTDLGPATVCSGNHCGNTLSLYSLEGGYIENNIIYNAAEGIDLKGFNDNMVVRNNTVFNTTYTGIRLACDNLNNLVEGNVVHDTISGNGIAIGRASNYNSVINNVFYNIYNGGIELDAAGCSTYGQIGTVAKNNIVYGRNNEIRNVGGEVGSDINYNFFDSSSDTLSFYWQSGEIDLATWISTSGFDINSSEGDPMYVDAANGDFRLQAGSSAIDKGEFIPGYHCDTSGGTTPSGCRVWYGTAPDIGAYEFVSAIVPPTCTDVNTDGKVNIIDLALVIYNQGQTAPEYFHLDLDNNDVVDAADIALVLGDFGGSGSGC